MGVPPDIQVPYYDIKLKLAAVIALEIMLIFTTSTFCSRDKFAFYKPYPKNGDVTKM